MAQASFKAKVVILEPIDPSQAPNGSVFLDSTNSDALTTKTTGGSTSIIGAASGDTLFKKDMVAGAAFAAKVPLSKRADGKVVAADSDSGTGQALIGYSLASSAGDGSIVQVLTVGANIAGALTGLGYTSGEEVYLSETGGYTNDPNSFTGNNDSIIKVGIADCAAGIASGTATDLIVFAEVITRP